MRYLLFFLLGGVGYAALELLWRGRTHLSMVLAGGVSLVLLAGVYNRLSFLPYVVLCALGAVVITAVEFITGAIVNCLMGLGVWDYSGRKHHVYGQICLTYSLIWFGLSAIAFALIQVVNAI